MLLWFADLMNVTEEVTIHRPNVSTLLSSAFITPDANQSSIKVCLIIAHSLLFRRKFVFRCMSSILHLEQNQATNSMRNDMCINI